MCTDSDAMVRTRQTACKARMNEKLENEKKTPIAMARTRQNAHKLCGGKDRLEKKREKEKKKRKEKEKMKTRYKPAVHRYDSHHNVSVIPVVARISPSVVETPADPVKIRFPANKLRKMVRSYMALLKEEVTVAEMATTLEMPMDTIRELLVEITKRCKAVTTVEGKRPGFKLMINRPSFKLVFYFIHSNWVSQICNIGLTK